jgi:putative glutathione S-transferase
MIYRKLKGLEHMTSISVVNAFMGDEGWTFEPGGQGIGDPINNATRMHQVHTHAMSDYTGRVTVPVLWGKHTHTIVSNESPEIIRMFNSEFDGVGAITGDFCPPELLEEIDELNDFIYPNINNGVYQAGFATTQAAYNEAVIDFNQQHNPGSL